MTQTGIEINVYWKLSYIPVKITDKTILMFEHLKPLAWFMQFSAHFQHILIFRNNIEGHQTGFSYISVCIHLQLEAT